MDAQSPLTEQPAAAPAAAPNAAPPAASGGLDFSKVDPARVTQVYQDPRFLAEAAHAYLSRGLPEGIKFLERAHNAAKENAFEALTRLEQGDGDGAIQAFNQSGRFTNATRAVNNGDGTWTLGDKEGRDITINPTNLKKTLLSPEAYFKATEEEKRTGILKQQAETQEQYRKDQNRYWERTLDNKTELEGVRAEGRAQAAAARVEAAQIAADARTSAAQAKSDADAHKADLNNRFGPIALYNDVLKKGIENGDKDAQQKADAALASHPDVETVVAPDGRVGLFASSQIGGDGKPRGRPVRMFDTIADYETLTGRKLPKAQKDAAAKAEPAKKPTPARRTAPLKPEAPPLNISANDVWGEDPEAAARARRLAPAKDESKYVDVGNY